MGKYIRQLPDAAGVADEHYFVTDDGSHNYKATWAQLKALLPTVSAFSVDPDTENYPGTLKLTLTNGTVLRVRPSDPSKQDLLEYDETPTKDSKHVMTSGAIFDAMAAKLDAKAFDAFHPATTEYGGEAGIVPAPSAGELRYLGSDGFWHDIDTEPTEDSANLVTSGGVFAAIAAGGGGSGGGATIVGVDVITLPPGSAATVTVEQTASGMILHFGIPKGDPGDGTECEFLTAAEVDALWAEGGEESTFENTGEMEF